MLRILGAILRDVPIRSPDAGEPGLASEDDGFHFVRSGLTPGLVGFHSADEIDLATQDPYRLAIVALGK